MWDASGGKRMMARSEHKIKVVPVFIFFSADQQTTSGLGSLIVEVSRSHTPRHTHTHTHTQTHTSGRTPLNE